MRELWVELSATMRRLRSAAEMSLRDVESRSGVGRGTLSQFETAKARPNRMTVEWYDDTFGGDGLLVSLYAEARGAHGPAHGAVESASYVAGDALTVTGARLPFGSIVPCGSSQVADWILHNTGVVAWRGRRLERVGARAGVRLIGSAATDPIPDCEPGDSVVCAAEFDVPAIPATYVAYWRVIDGEGRAVLPFDPQLCVQVVARDFR